jgi:hypothetical protein
LKKKGDDTTNKLRDGKGDIKKDISEIQFIWEYFENIYFSKLKYQEEIGELLDIYDPPILNINSLNRAIINNEIIKNIPTKKPRSRGAHCWILSDF